MMPSHRPVTWRLATIAALGLALSACGGPASETDRAADDAFDTEFLSSCKTTSEQQGVPAAIADRICTCVSDRIGEEYSGMEKANLSEEDVLPMMSECMNEAVSK
ncbi:hypothetical protein [Qipengyuania sp. JC766]|uniref:hypothetical protein n=1 Tax=Qipengyuania sp. JC766 TaxID=3232139 RepID=UPI00345A5431